MAINTRVELIVSASFKFMNTKESATKFPEMINIDYSLHIIIVTLDSVYGYRNVYLTAGGNCQINLAFCHISSWKMQNRWSFNKLIRYFNCNDLSKQTEDKKGKRNNRKEMTSSRLWMFCRSTFFFFCPFACIENFFFAGASAVFSRVSDWGFWRPRVRISVWSVAVFPSFYIWCLDQDLVLTGEMSARG